MTGLSAGERAVEVRFGRPTLAELLAGFWRWPVRVVRGGVQVGEVGSGGAPAWAAPAPEGVVRVLAVVRGAAEVRLVLAVPEDPAVRVLRISASHRG